MLNPKVGDTIAYTAFGGEQRIVLVTKVSDDIKNGRAGFCGMQYNSVLELESVWGYSSQITSIKAGV